MAIWNYSSYSQKEVEARTVPEQNIISILVAIRDKPNWWDKVYEKDIVHTWYNESMAELDDDEQENDDGRTYQHEYYNDFIFTYALEEARWQATQVQQQLPPPTSMSVRTTGRSVAAAKPTSLPAAVGGVFCLYGGIPQTLVHQLLDSVATLRSRPAIGAKKAVVDRHPGMPQMVDLVHPSLYCYEKGTSKVLPNCVGAEAVQQPRWKTFLGGTGVTEDVSIGAPAHHNPPNHYDYMDDDFTSKDGLQWLPAEFHVNKEGTECNITSYINSLHPIQDAAVYPQISKLFLQALPLLEDALTESLANQQHPRPLRVKVPSPYQWIQDDNKPFREQQDNESEEAYDRAR